MAEKSGKSIGEHFCKGLKASSVAPIVGIPMFSIASSPVVLKMQGAWGAKDIMNEFALEYVDRVNKMAEGRLRIDYLTAGAVVKPLKLRMQSAKEFWMLGIKFPCIGTENQKLHRCLAQGLSTVPIQNKCWVG